MRGGPRSAFSRGCVPRPTAHPPRHAVPRATCPASNPRPPVPPLTSPRRTAGLPRVPRGGAGEEGAFPINSGRADASPARRARFLSGACRNGRPGSERPHAELRLHLLGAAQGSPRAPAQLFPTVSGRPGPSPRVRHLGVGPDPAPPAPAPRPSAQGRAPADRPCGQGCARAPPAPELGAGTEPRRRPLGGRGTDGTSAALGQAQPRGRAGGPRGRAAAGLRGRLPPAPRRTRSPADPPRRRACAQRAARVAGAPRGRTRRASAAAHLALGRAVRPRPGVEPRSRGRRAASWAQARAG